MARTDTQITGSTRDRLTDLALRAMIGGACALPVRARMATMGWTAAHIAGPVLGWRARALANLAHVWPHLSKTQAEAIAKAAARNAGRTIIENYDPASLIDRMRYVAPTGPGYQAVLDAQKAGRPVMFVTGHFGNYEAPRAALVARGFAVGGLYRPMKNPYFNAHYAANMHALSEPVFEQGRRGTMGLLRHLKTGGMAVLLFDVFAGRGAPLSFLGQPAPTALSAAEMALRTDALLIPIFGVRTAQTADTRAEFDAPIPHSDPETMMAAATAALERRITEYPGQWFWMHRRWKPERQAQRQRNRAAAKIGP